MSRYRPMPTLADYLVIAVSPALIMVLIGSLVFFLLGIAYRGGYGERVHMVFALFIMAAVLIGRISIELGAERAMMYALPLALVTALAVGRFLDLPLPLNLGLIALVWWSAHKLVIDCTLIDESQDYSGEGLLQVAGLTERAKPGGVPGEPQPPPTPGEGLTSRDAPPPWWRRWLHGPVRPHAPGVWIVYFSLVALPLFGLGQRLIPAADAAHRRYAFGCLVVYCASALGLLLATSFLGLRRYLRQRRLQMPAAMAGTWVTVGCVLIVLLLAAAALLPRPNPEYAISEVPRVFSPEQRASRYAVGDASAEKNVAGAPPGSKEAPEREKDQQQAKAPPGHAQKGPKDSGGDKGARPSPRGDEKGSKAGDSRESKSGEGGPSKGKDAQPSKGKDDEQLKGGEDQGSKRGKARADRSRDDSQGDRPKQAHAGGSAKKEEPQDKSKSSGSASPPSRPPETPTAGSVPQYRLAAQSMFDIVKWAFYAVPLLVALYVAWRSREELARMLRSLLELWGDLRRWLFGGGVRPKVAAVEEPSEAPPVALRRLAEFVDPFAAGTAHQLPPDELVRYSFEALEAWGRQSGCPRQPDQTAHEFAQQVGLLAEELAHDARRLADLYSRAAYAPGSLSAASVKPLARLWQKLLAAETQASPLENP